MFVYIDSLEMSYMGAYTVVGACPGHYGIQYMIGNPNVLTQNLLAHRIWYYADQNKLMKSHGISKQ